MTLFQIILMLAAGFFAYQVYVYIQGIDEEAEPEFMREQEAVEAPAPTADELIEEADRAYMEDDIEKAGRLLEDIVRDHPNLAEARNKLAFVLSKQRNEEAALKQYEASLEIDDNDDMTHNALATLLASMNENERAEEHYRKALAIDDNYEVTWFNYANLMLNLGRKDEAREMYQKAVDIAPGFEEATEALERLR